MGKGCSSIGTGHLKVQKNLGIWEGWIKGEGMRTVRAAGGTRLERLWVPD